MEEQNEISENSNKGLKSLVVILALLLIGSFVYIYKVMNDNKEIESVLISEKRAVQKDLEIIKDSLDAAIASNTSLSDDLMIQRDKVVKLSAEIENSKDDIASLKIIKAQFSKLKNEVYTIVKENNALKEDNRALTLERDSTKVALVKIKKGMDDLNNNNKSLAQEIQKGSKISIMPPQITTFKVKSSGKMVLTDKANSVDVLKITFTIAENQIAKPGDRVFYVQILDSNNSVIGDKETIKFDNLSLVYSYMATIKYENQNVQSVKELQVSNLKKGSFYVNIFDKNQIVAKSNFDLK